ncbi:MAG: hypothetical protein CME06_07235 [Gemmatimonadetes bacterium]|nr:hypothetical protein [Gemmatimonadota bacterium]
MICHPHLLALLCATGQASGAPSATATGISRALNPAISVNALFLGRASNIAPDEVGQEEEGDDAHEHDAHDHAGPTRGLSLQEAEIRMTSAIDPYARADIVLAYSPGEGLALEEGHATFDALPGDMRARVGVLKPAFGKHAPQHVHNFLFADAPWIIERSVGADVHGDAGLELSWLAPLPHFAELTAQVTNGSEGTLFHSPDDEDLAYLGRLRNLWDLGENGTLELSGSNLSGRNEHLGWTHLTGVDLTLQWAPTRSVNRKKLIWQSELIRLSRQDTPAADPRVDLSAYSALSWKLSRRFWLQCRLDLIGLPSSDDGELRSAGAMQIAFVPSEFQSIRLFYGHRPAEGHEESTEASHEVRLQYSITIGSHPAHSYR